MKKLILLITTVLMFTSSCFNDKLDSGGLRHYTNTYTDFQVFRNDFYNIKSYFNSHHDTFLFNHNPLFLDMSELKNVMEEEYTLTGIDFCMYDKIYKNKDDHPLLCSNMSIRSEKGKITTDNYIYAIEYYDCNNVIKEDIVLNDLEDNQLTLTYNNGQLFNVTISKKDESKDIEQEIIDEAKSIIEKELKNLVSNL